MKQRKKRLLEKSASRVILNLYQSTGIEKNGDYRQFLENHGVMGMSYISFLSTEAGAVYMNFRVTEFLVIWTEKIIEIDTTENEKPSPDFLLEKGPEVICAARSEKRVKLRLGGGGNVIFTNLGTVWKLLRPSWCPHPQANLNEEVLERMRLSQEKDEDLGNMNVVHKLILAHREESKERTYKSRDEPPKRMEPGTCLGLATGDSQ